MKKKSHKHLNVMNDKKKRGKSPMVGSLDILCLHYFLFLSLFSHILSLCVDHKLTE